MPLPRPDSAEFRGLPISNEAREIYRLLHVNQATPFSMRDIRNRLPELGGHEQLDRRRRELNRYFVVEHSRVGKETFYRLVDAKPAVLGGSRISERDRAAVLSVGRCAMCGRTPLEDHVKLQVDHKIPQEWGGTHEIGNLQPLCEECNRGKKAHFAEYAGFSREIRNASAYESVHQRIGELLKSFDAQEVPSDVIALVANQPGSAQEDWQKRLRELRTLGWRIATTRKREGRRTRSFYQLREWRQWPAGDIRKEIRRLERLRASDRARSQRGANVAALDS